MKKIFLAALSIGLLSLSGCRSLDLSPLAEGSSENWYKTQQQFVMSLDDLYRPALWYWEANRLFHSDRFTDDWNQRGTTYDWPTGTISSDTGWIETCWLNTYKAITRTNTILENVNEQRGKMDDAVLDGYEGEACFFRACFYSYVIFLWGDAPFYTEYLTMDDAYQTGRTDKAVILEQVYKDFDNAIAKLPTVSTTDVQRATRGAAYAFKARTAIWMLDWATAAAAAKGCMDLGVYSLHADFGELFLTKTRKSPEYILTLPRSKELLDNAISVTSMLPRYAGGNSTAQPSWELFCSFTCTDGKPIDESPRYDPSQPFKNRDPRISATVVEFGTEFLGFTYDPGATQIKNFATGAMMTNDDTQLNQQHASWNGLTLKKGVDTEWSEDQATDVSVRLMRYADVLLMYAEAKMELDEIDATVLKAVNEVRARGYGVGVTETALYPAVTETNQAKLRTIIRNERHVELAWENRRWFDLVRWRLAGTAINRNVFSLPQAAGLQANIASGDYFFPKGVLPAIDEDGLVDLSPLYATGKIRQSSERKFLERQYLLPIPSKDVINVGLKQNDDY